MPRPSVGAKSRLGNRLSAPARPSELAAQRAGLVDARSSGLDRRQNLKRLREKCSVIGMSGSRRAAGCEAETPSAQTTTPPLRTLPALWPQVAGNKHRRLLISVPALPVALLAAPRVGGSRVRGQRTRLLIPRPMRGLDFLFSRNRLNVAVSRAQCLAFLVCSPRLRDANCPLSSRCASRTRSAG